MKKAIDYLLRNNIVRKERYIGKDYYEQINIVNDKNIRELREINDIVVIDNLYRDDSHDSYVIMSKKNSNYLILGLNHPFIFNGTYVIQCDEYGVHTDRENGERMCSLENDIRKRKINQYNRISKINQYLKFDEKDLLFRKIRQMFIFKIYYYRQLEINRIREDDKLPLKIKQKMRNEIIEDAYLTATRWAVEALGYNPIKGHKITKKKSRIYSPKLQKSRLTRKRSNSI
jgi:hypothetical protein